MVLDTLHSKIRSANQEGHPWRFNPVTAMFQVQLSQDEIRVDPIEDFGNADKVLWERLLRSLNLLHTWDSELVFFSGEEANFMVEVLWDFGQGRDPEWDWQNGFIDTAFLGETVNNMLLKESLAGFGMDYVYTEANFGLITVPHLMNFHGGQVTSLAANDMATMVSIRKDALDVLVVQFCQVWEYETYQGMFFGGESFHNDTAAKLAALLIRFSNLRVHREFLLRELLPCFRGRVAELGSGRYTIEGLTGFPLMNQEVIDWVTRIDV